ncbi:hypothetical protein LX97_00289 [Nonlabens dokdonensis]|uniref:Secreted protein n=2 Tax=Nonlabens dokdonensis TaxID=328515 RepID=L7W5X8_NONDD|nr:hypothetical protein [Nonlabens dokdonensis]AGC75597.1 secreted protein [Nonlabens dokdonensis DSW-6]PZX43289.1 hypothetical protein LX97_00289 [Nonlabens dokdonensis]
MNFFLIPLFLIISYSTIAQETDSVKSIDAQFETLITESNNFKEFKVIKQRSINELRRNTNEHLDQLNDKISSLENSIATKDGRIASLEQELQETNASLTGVNAEKDSMNFFGIQTNKSVYNTVVWSIVGVLGFLFVLMSMRFKSSNSTTKAAQKQLQSTEEELEELRRKSIEKEQKLGRQLQDERNKLSKLKSDK